MSNCIKFHKFNRYFKFILLTTLFRFLNICLLEYNHSKTFEDVSIYKLLYRIFNLEIKTYLADFRIVEFFFNYIGTLIFSLLSRFYELKISEKKFEEFFQINEPNAITQRELSHADLIINYSKKEKKDNILYKFKNYLINNSSIFIYFVISFIWVATEIAIFILFNYVKDADFWFFEILIVSIIYSKIFLVKIYKHQKLTIILNILFPSILKIICIILTFNSNDNSIMYLKYPWWIVIGFLIHSILNIILSFINCSLKSFLDLKYTTTSQLLMFYSAAGTIISFLAGIIITYVPCSSIENNENSISETVCKIKDNVYFYFDSFKIYFETYSEEDFPEKIIRTIIIILDSLTFFLYRYLFLLSIKHAGPVHIYFQTPIFYILQKTILVINNVIMDNECFKNTSNFRIPKYFLDISGDTFCLIGFFIYLEIIELNFCKLNYNLKRNISKRSIDDDSSSSIIIRSESENYEDMENINGQKAIEMTEM